jgi:3-oxoacyl-[acyl-carrier protein] reductase
MDLAGKTALVTGGSGDIGGAICDALGAAGADIAASYIGNTDAANATVDRVARMGRRAVAVHLDQRD